MESTVVELSRYTASDTPSNSQWTNNISNSKKVSVNNNDIIQVKQCFIDTRQSTSGDIELLEDIAWTLQFGYYIVNHGINLSKIKLFNGGSLQAEIIVDGQPYLLYNFSDDPNPIVASAQGKPVIDSFTINIKAGVYTREFLAAFITRQIQGNPCPQNIPLQNLQFSSATYTPQYNPDSDNCVFFEPTKLADPNKFITSFNKPLLLALGVGEIPQPNLAGVNVYINNSIQNPNIGYTQCSFFPFLKDATYSNNTATSTPIVSGPDAGLNPDSGTKAIFNGASYGLYDGCCIGAGEVALEYNVDGSNKFQFTYAHTPLINKGNEVTGVLLNTSTSTDINLTTPTKFINNFSGILFFNTFTNLSPIDINGAPDGRNDSFFAQLGLDFYDICYTDVPSNPIFNRLANPTNILNFGLENEIFLAKTTRNFNAIQNLANTATISIYNVELVGNGSTYAILGPNFIFNTSTTTVPVNFSNQPISSVNNAGHYLVELICAYSNNEYINATQSYQVKAIVGTYYLSSDSFCLTNGPDSYIYQHKGEPINLSSITVRLLNPITKQEATNIGPNSTIYLMITKEEQPPPPPQPEKK
jgi:hypothetical protein